MTAEGKQNPAVVEIDARAVGLVSPLPQQVRARWDSWQADGLSGAVRREVSLDEIQSRLQAAEAKRAEIQAWVMSKARRRGGKRKELSDTTEQRAQRIEEKLAIAEAKRQSTLDAVRLKAAASLSRMQEAENRLAERQAQLAQRIEDSLAAADVRRAARQEAELARLMAAHAQVLDRLAHAQEKQDHQRSALTQRLEQADGQRESHLAAIAAHAAQNVARVKEVAILMRERAAADSEDRRVALQERLDRATQQRAESVAAMAAAQPSMRSTERFLQRQAYIISGLRRKVSSRKVQRYWRTFAQNRQTTRALAIQFVATGVTSLQLPAPDEDEVDGLPEGAEEETAPPQPRSEARPAVAVMGVRTGLMDASGQVQSEAPKDAFETFAEAMQAPATLRAAQALLRRLETRAAMRQATGLSDISGMLRRLFPKTARSGQPLERYPPRVFLCAFMIINHPRVVFNTRGEREQILADAAKDMITVFEALLALLLEPGSSSRAVTRPGSARSTPQASPASSPARPIPLQPSATAHPRPPTGLAPRTLSFAREQAPPTAAANPPSGIGAAVAAADAGRGVPPLMGSNSLASAGPSFMTLLTRFDQAWVSYLEQFVAWKFADVASLQSELIRIAVEMESSMLGKVGPDGKRSDRVRTSADLQAVVEQVQHDHQLLRERLQRLGGTAAIARLEAALTAARASATAEQAAAAEAASMADSGSSPSSSPARSSPYGSPMRSPYGSPVRPGLHPQSRGSSASQSPQRGGAGRADPEQAGPARGNEGLMWELMYDLDWQLPAEEAEVAWRDASGATSVMQEGRLDPTDLPPSEIATAVQRHIKRIADQAFWDAVEGTLSGNGPEGGPSLAPAQQVANLLADLGADLAASLPDGARRHVQELTSQLDRERLLDALTQSQAHGMAGVNTTALFGLLETMARMLRDMGSAAREADSNLVHAELRSRLGLAVSQGDGPGIAAATCRALRVLAAQLRLLKLDSANWQLRQLARGLADGAGVRYAREKFVAGYGIPPSPAPLAEMASKLPHCRAWLALTSGQLPQLELSLQPLLTFLSSHPTATPDPSQNNGIPINLRAGRGRVGASAGSEVAAGPKPAAALLAPVQPRSWRGVVRLGLVGLVSGEIPVGPSNAPETLGLDLARLHAAQNAFQQLIVLAACLLLIQQASRQPTPSSPGQAAPATVEEAKQRLVAVLADPHMRLPDLSSEAARLAGQGGNGEADAAMQAGLSRMLTRSGGAFKALAAGVACTLQLHLLSGPWNVASDATLQAAASGALARCGAGSLKAEVAQLAQDLGRIAAISEAVHVDIYERLSADML